MFGDQLSLMTPKPAAWTATFGIPTCRLKSKVNHISKENSSPHLAASETSFSKKTCETIEKNGQRIVHCYLRTRWQSTRTTNLGSWSMKNPLTYLPSSSVLLHVWNHKRLNKLCLGNPFCKQLGKTLSLPTSPLVENLKRPCLHMSSPIFVKHRLRRKKPLSLTGGPKLLFPKLTSEKHKSTVNTCPHSVLHPRPFALQHCFAKASDAE